MPNQKMKRLLLSIALACAAAPAIAQSGRQPSAEALALAQALDPERVFVFEAGTVDATRAMIERSLLNTHFVPLGASCEPRNGECAAIARQIAEREAPPMHARHKAAVERAYARYFDAHLSDADIEAARAFLASPSGRAFADAVGALAMLRLPRTGGDDLYRITMEEFTGTGVGEGLHNEFHDRTAHLPRARQRAVPPPPRLSPPPPEERR
jgi:hypothetical protein